ncbi:MAG: fibronectin type III domain-containing protein [Acidimicrobiia bacterium]|nr:fibronectin type III domain-containing protein [Acidimicrobiia bacterium]MYC44685.1 fibronectin type III domain-containing protein [Acidimicrobiia bacterium]
MREHRIGGLAAGTQYRLRLNALDAEGALGALTVATFVTLAPPVRGVAAAPTGAGGVQVSWNVPEAWTPAGYLLHWRLRGVETFIGEVPLGAAARSHVVTGLSDAVEYVLRVTPLSASGRRGDPVDLDVTLAEGGLVMLAGAGADWLLVRWAQTFAPDAAEFRLRWRETPAGDDGPEWSSVDLAATVREQRIGGLTVGTRYRLRLIALDRARAQGAAAVATFATLTPPVRDLAGTATAHDAVTLSWDGPAGWSPVGYVVQWRLRGPNEFLGRLELPPGRRAQTVEGLTGGVEYVFSVTARTAAGTLSRPAAVGVTTPAAPDTDLVLEVSVPAYCIADEGSRRSRDRLDPDTGQVDVVYRRVDVASVPLQWRITGGQAPYTLTVLGAEHAGATGTTEVSCARAGLNLENLPTSDTNVVEAGPKTLTIEAADAADAATTKTATIEIIETAHTAGSWHEGDHLEPGRTYSFFGLFIEIPERTRIAYRGAVESDNIYDAFAEAVEGSRITSLLIDKRARSEARHRFSRTVSHVNPSGGVSRDLEAPLTDAENEMWDLFLANIRTTPFPEGDPRNEPTAPLSPSGGATGQAAAATPQCSYDGTTLVDFTADLWRPYGRIPGTSPVTHGLSCDRLVAVHPSLLVGDAITVCVAGGAMDDLLVPAIETATGEWNDELAPDHDNLDPTLRRGLGYAPFAFDAASPDCPTDNSGLTDVSDTDTDYVQVVDSRMDCNADIATACDVDSKPLVPGADVDSVTPASAKTQKSADPPRITRNLMSIFVGAGAV